jgi:hypothetical protein
MSPSSSSNGKSSKKHEISKHRMIIDGVLIGLLFDPKDTGCTVLRNVGELIPAYSTLYPRI